MALPDGASTDTFTVKFIVANLYSQVDEEGNSFSIFSEIVDDVAHKLLCNLGQEKGSFVQKQLTAAKSNRVVSVAMG